MTETERGRLGDIAKVLDGPTLRHLAACADARRRPEVIDPGAAADELAAMFAAGRRPTIGWWRRHLRPTKPVTSNEKGNNHEHH